MDLTNFIPILVLITIILLVIFIGVRVIIKESEKLQRDLKEERDLAKAIVTSMGEGLLVLDTKFKIRQINPAAEKFLETTQAEAVGQKWAEFVKAYKGEKEIKFNERSSVWSLKNGKAKVTTITDDHYYETRSGRKFAIVAMTSPLIRDGNVVGVVKVFRDASKEKEIDRMKTDFISLASHQLRSPLSAIKWFTELLNDQSSGPLNNEQKEFTKNIANSTERMIELVNSLLNISRIESGRIIIDPVSTDLSKLVGQVIEELKRKIEEKKDKIIVSKHETLPPISIDPKLIRHVYLNLIDNSIKYSPEGTEITVIISKKDDQIISQISDNGYGIPEEEQNKLFQRFFRARNIIQKVTEGTGLGLYLAKAIVESSGGKIWFKSNADRGTTFWFSLPVAGTKAKKGEVTLDV